MFLLKAAIFLLLLCSVEGSNPRKDLAIILDCSKSISQSRYESNIHFIDTLLDYMSISPATTRVALITFSSQAKIQFNFEKYTNRECVRRNIKFLYNGSRKIETNINAALQKAVQLFETCRGYAKEKEIYIISDGKWNEGDPPTKSIAALDKLGVKTHVFEVGKTPNRKYLLELASSPKKQYYMKLEKKGESQLKIIKILTQRKESVRACKGNGKVLDECNRECTCVNGVMKDCYRIRKEFTSHTPEEKRRFLKAYLKITTEEPVKSRLAKFLSIHSTWFWKGIHERYMFLPWHRWYTYAFENFIREADCRITVPYWDWSYWSKVAWKVGPHIWRDDEYGLGGNGSATNNYCVLTGPFAKNSWSPPAPENLTGIYAAIREANEDCSDVNLDGMKSKCLRRSFNHVPANLADVMQTLSLPCSKFMAFDESVRNGYHNDLHNDISGHMGSNYASSSPEFFFHHGFLDNIWYRWQLKGHECKYAYYPKENSKLAASRYRAVDFLDSHNQGECVRVKYDDFIGKKIQSGLKMGKPHKGTQREDEPCRKHGKSYAQDDPENFPKSAFRRLKEQMDIEAKLEGDFELS